MFGGSGEGLGGITEGDCTAAAPIRSAELRCIANFDGMWCDEEGQTRGLYRPNFSKAVLVYAGECADCVLRTRAEAQTLNAGGRLSEKMEFNRTATRALPAGARRSPRQGRARPSRAASTGAEGNCRRDYSPRAEHQIGSAQKTQVRIVLLVEAQPANGAAGRSAL